MSFKVFFSFSTGLKKAVWVQPRTLELFTKDLEETEKTFRFHTTTTDDGRIYWTRPNHELATWASGGDTHKDDQILCKAVEAHNRNVRWFHDHLQKATEKKTKTNSERITPKQVAAVWRGTEMLSAPVERWDRHYYRERMENLFEALRGRENEDGYSFSAEALNERQAAGVVILLSQWLDYEDIRLDCPNNCDHLASSYDGGYTWCSICGPVAESDVSDKENNCRRRGCELRKRRIEYDEEYRQLATRRRRERMLENLKVGQTVTALDVSKELYLHPKNNALNAFQDLAHLERLGYLQRSEINGKIHFTRLARPVEVGVGPNYVPA